MSEDVKIGAFVLIALAIIASSVLKGCAIQNDGYYTLASDCVKSGGSWVPSWDGICVHGARP